MLLAVDETDGVRKDLRQARSNRSKAAKEREQEIRELRNQLSDLHESTKKSLEAMRKQVSGAKSAQAQAFRDRDEAMANLKRQNDLIIAANGNSMGREPRSPIQPPSLELTDLRGKPLPGSFSNGKRR